LVSAGEVLPLVSEDSSSLDGALELVEAVGPGTSLESLLGAVVGEVVGATEPVMPLEVDDVAPGVVLLAVVLEADGPGELDVGVATVVVTAEVDEVVGWPVASPPGGDDCSAEQAPPRSPIAANQAGLK
jgi:hypothetical protein